MMKNLNELDLDSQETKDWMDKHFKAGEYCILSLLMKDKSLTPEEQANELANTLKPYNFNIVILPGEITRVMVNLSEARRLVDALQSSKFSAAVSQKVRAELDFETDEGTEQ